MSMPPQANLIFLLITLKSAIIDTKINSYSIEGNRLEITMHKNSKTIFVHGLKCKFDFFFITLSRPSQIAFSKVSCQSKH